jgi:hypothetical protein
MSSLDLDFDTQLNNLEQEWRLVYDDSIAARAEYRVLAASGAKASRLSTMSDRLDRAEAKKARIMAKIERLEDSMLGEE